MIPKLTDVETFSDPAGLVVSLSVQTKRLELGDSLGHALLVLLRRRVASLPTGRGKPKISIKLSWNQKSSIHRHPSPYLRHLQALPELHTLVTKLRHVYLGDMPQAFLSIECLDIRQHERLRATDVARRWRHAGRRGTTLTLRQTRGQMSRISHGTRESAIWYGTKMKVSIA